MIQGTDYWRREKYKVGTEGARFEMSANDEREDKVHSMEESREEEHSNKLEAP